MEEALAAIRQAMADEEAGEMTLAPTSRVAEAGLLSREATAAVGSAFNTLTETVKKHEPTLEDVVRETLRPMLKSWLDENLPRVVERMVQAEIERVTHHSSHSPGWSLPESNPCFSLERAKRPRLLTTDVRHQLWEAMLPMCTLD